MMKPQNLSRKCFLILEMDLVSVKKGSQVGNNMCFTVERVVEFYEGKTEDIINALLEDNLHPEIAALDRNMLSKAELEQSKSFMIQ